MSSNDIAIQLEDALAEIEGAREPEPVDRRRRAKLRERVRLHMSQSPGYHSRAEIGAVLNVSAGAESLLLSVLMEFVGEHVLELSCRDGRSVDGTGVSIYVPIYRYNWERTG